MSARTIALPPGTRCRLAMRPPHHIIVAAPPPLEPTLDALFAKPSIVGLFSHDQGVTWPDRDGCRWAGEYLRAGNAIAFQFESLADALSCHKRLLASGAQS